MVCGISVLWVDARRKGSGIPYRKAIRWYHPGIPVDEDYVQKSGGTIEVCDGTIVADISARDEPEWGGSYATLEITYTCTKCKNMNYHQTLPQNAESLSAFVTAAIAKE